MAGDHTAGRLGAGGASRADEDVDAGERERLREVGRRGRVGDEAREALQRADASRGDGAELRARSASTSLRGRARSSGSRGGRRPRRVEVRLQPRRRMQAAGADEGEVGVVLVEELLGMAARRGPGRPLGRGRRDVATSTPGRPASSPATSSELVSTRPDHVGGKRVGRLGRCRADVEDRRVAWLEELHGDATDRPLAVECGTVRCGGAPRGRAGRSAGVAPPWTGLGRPAPRGARGRGGSSRSRRRARWRARRCARSAGCRAARGSGGGGRLRA